MSETNERSVASTGSGSRLPVGLATPTWAEKARGMTFFEVPVHELSREELLAVVGYLADQLYQERAMHRSTWDVIKAASAVSQ